MTNCVNGILKWIQWQKEKKNVSSHRTPQILSSAFFLIDDKICQPFRWLYGGLQVMMNVRRIFRIWSDSINKSHIDIIQKNGGDEENSEWALVINILDRVRIPQFNRSDWIVCFRLTFSVWMLNFKKKNKVALNSGCISKFLVAPNSNLPMHLTNFLFATKAGTTYLFLLSLSLSRSFAVRSILACWHHACVKVMMFCIRHFIYIFFWFRKNLAFANNIQLLFPWVSRNAKKAHRWIREKEIRLRHTHTSCTI